MNLTLAEINRLLPSQSDDNLTTVKDTNRALAPRPAANSRRYRAETDNRIPDAITLAVSPEATTHSDRTLTIRPDAGHPLRIIDGQHRRPAIANPLAGQSQTDSHTGPLREAIASLDLTKSAPLHEDLMARLNLLNPQTGKPVSRNSPEWRNAIQTTCQQVSETCEG